MRALVYHGNKDIRLEEEWPEPRPGPGEARLRLTYTSICATDIEEWQHGPLWVTHGEPNPVSGRILPLVLGHEASGRVDQLGEGVEGLAVGDRVSVRNVRTCEECYWCLRNERSVCPNMSVFGLSADGGLAEYAVWRADHLLKLPDSISDKEAPLVEPTTVAVHGVRRSGASLSDTVAVIGCGTVGLLTLQVLKSVSARVIAVDVRPESLEMARQLGADETVDASADDTAATLRDLTGGIGPDIVMETAGAANTPVDAIDWVRRRGKVVLVGIYSATPQLDFNQIVGFEREVIGSVAADPEDYRTAIGLIAAGKVDVKPLITATVPLERVIPDGFERMIQPQKDVYRIVVGSGA